MHFRTKIRSLFNPDMYQGWGNKNRYFEGWYFKVTNASESKAFAFIPGIAMDEAGESHAFIQFLDGKNKRSEYHSFPARSFVPSDKKFEIRIGDNYFSAGGMSLDLPDASGSLQFHDSTGWPCPWYSPGIMGPYTFAPFMECNHGIVSMDHIISGSMTINGEVIDFTNGRGYIEKDWGHSFPSAYIWMQSNHFSEPGISFKASVARVPWITGTFSGFIAGLWFDNRLFRFNEYNRSEMTRLNVTDSTAELEFRNRTTLLHISAPLDQATPLASPVRGFMGGRIEESMTSLINLTLTERGTGQIIYNGVGRNACVEIYGDIQTLKPHCQTP